MSSVKSDKGTSISKPEGSSALADNDIITKQTVTRRSALATLGVSLSVGALSTLMESCAALPVDADSYDGVRSDDGYRQPSDAGRQRDIKIGDGSDYTVYADFRDLDSDARDTSDHFRAREADRSSANDYD